MLFNGEQMARHGKTLAQGHRFILKPGPDLLRGRLAENEKILHETYAILRQAASARLAISPAGEWLLDSVERCAKSILGSTGASYLAFF